MTTLSHSERIVWIIIETKLLVVGSIDGQQRTDDGNRCGAGDVVDVAVGHR
jgi:hypothetical protein